MKFQRNLAKILPAVTAISALCVTSAFAFTHHGTPQPPTPHYTTTFSPAICGDDDSVSATFVSVGSGLRNKAEALELFTDDTDDSIPYGIVANGSFPTWNSISFDAADVDDDSFLNVTVTSPDGLPWFQALFMEQLPLATHQSSIEGFFSLICTAATMSSDSVVRVPFLPLPAGSTVRTLCTGQFNDGDTLFVANVSLNNGPIATAQLITETQDCVTVFP